jgi:hypothetical protein
MNDVNEKFINSIGDDTRNRFMLGLWRSVEHSLGIDLMCSLFESIDRQLRSCAFDEKLKATLEKSYE